MNRFFTRFGLLEAFVAIVTVLFLVLTLLDYKQTQQAARAKADAVLLQSERAVTIEVERLDSAVRSLLAQIESGCILGTLDFNRPETVNPVVIPVLDEYAALTSVIQGDAEGNGYLLLRNETGWTTRLRRSKDLSTFTWVQYDKAGKQLSRKVVADSYDPRKRPWYLQAPSSGVVAFSSPYLFRNANLMGITASKVLSCGRGVVGVAITLSDLSHSLGLTTSHWTGTSVVITDPAGTIIASSDAAAFEKLLALHSTPLPSLGAPAFAVQRAAVQARSRDGHPFHEIDTRHGVHYTRVSDIPLNSLCRVSVVISVPRSVFTASFYRALAWKTGVYLAVLLAASALYLRYYILPLKELVRLMGEYDLSRPRLFPPTKRRDEVGMLYSHVRDMTGKLIEGMSALTASEEHYRLLVEDSNSIIVRWQPSGIITYINPFGALFLGYQQSQLVGCSMGVIFPHPETGGWLEFQQAAGTIRSHGSHLCENVTRDGRTFWINWTNARMEKAADEAGEILSVGNDVTVWKEAEQRLAERQEAYRLLAENMQDVIWRTTPEYLFTYLSPADERQRGFPPSRVLGKPIWSTFARKSCEEFLDLVQRQCEALERGELLTAEPFQAEQLTIEGTIWVEMVCTPVYDGDTLTGFQGVTRDITSRRKAEEAVRNARDYLHSVLNTIGDPILVKDEQSRLVLLNDAACALYGCGRELVLGKTDYDFFPPEQADEFVRVDRLVLETGVSNVNEEPITDPDGSIRTLITRKARYVNPAGQRFVVAALRDITELREAQEKVVASARQAGMAEIAVNVLHNIGNVLNSVGVSAGVVMNLVRNSRVAALGRAVSLVNENGSDLAAFLTIDPKGKLLPGYLDKLAETLAQEQSAVMEELQTLRGNIEHIGDIIGTQQRYAGASGVIQPVQVRGLMEDALRINGELLSRYSVAVTRDFAPAAELPLDNARVLLIVVNLIRNAIFAMAAVPGKRHQLALRMEVLPKGEIPRLRIQVIDDGEGIPPENMTRIFIHGFTTRKGGHGFGLHSCALAAREMGGTLTAHSDGRGKGATFTLEIPVGAK